MSYPVTIWMLDTAVKAVSIIFWTMVFAPFFHSCRK